MESYWVKKWVSNREWENWYSKVSSYCWLERSGNEIAVGFLSTMAPDSQILFKLSQPELEKVNAYRRADRIMPYPLEEVSPEMQQQALSNEIDVTKMF